MVNYKVKINDETAYLKVSCLVYIFAQLLFYILILFIVLDLSIFQESDQNQESTHE